MQKRLFGTDGVRGVANTELTCELAYKLGRAARRFLGKRIVIGRDTRRSGQMLEAALSAGIMSAGGDVYLAGIIPTPAIALLTSKGDYDGGVVISASHNPPKYNGIKFFNSQGFKLPDALEDEMQVFVEQDATLDEEVVGRAVGRSYILENAEEVYISNAIETSFSDSATLKGLTIVVDCGHGASYMTTPEALRRLDANVIVLNESFNGDDINVECGSTNLEQLKEAVVKYGADLGLAHDGDADRLQSVDRFGNLIDGDQIEAICAVDMKARGVLANNTVVSTVMCNLGFKKAMEAQGIEVITTNVGDRYVLERMIADGLVLGGEQSGHMIFLDQNTTGDGLVTALNLLASMRRAGKPLHELAKVMQRFPQALINVEVEDKIAAFESSELQGAIEKAKEFLGNDGNVLVRPSGTESLIRIMVEAADMKTAEGVAKNIAASIS